VEFYEHEEAEALYAAAAGQWRTLIEFGIDVGLRPGRCTASTGTGSTGCAAGLRSSA
jgi:hypothetical protein